MKIKNVLSILLFSLIATLCITSVAAIDENNLNNDSSVLDSSNTLDEDVISISEENDIISAPQTIIVDEIELNHNEMGPSGTIQNTITNKAKAGDTIIINGRSYVHCHFVVDKKLTIISNVGTTMEVCPSNTAGSNHHGIFYISPQASGTVIQGFTFVSDVSDSDDYGVLVSGASNVVIKDCKVSNTGYSDAIRIENSKNTLIENVSVSDAENGIRIKNSQGTIVRNSIVQDSDNGICDVDSTRSTITSNNVFKNNVGISVSGSSNNPTISFNNITLNENGISLTSSETINILSNYIALNNNHGVYVNCKIKKINIIGNFFYKNAYEEVFNDVNTKGLYVKGGENLDFINNNYFVGFDNRPVQRASSVGGGVFLQYAFELNTNVACPIIYSTYDVQWAVKNYRLQLTEITQSKKGVYSVSIVDANGNAAKGLSSVPVTFYLNKNNNYAAPQEGDIFRTVMMVDGTATVRFYTNEFNESGNIVTVVTPGTGDYLTSDQNKNVRTFNVDDKSIPGEVIRSKLIVSDLTTYPNSNMDYVVTLMDINNNAIANEPVLINIGSKSFNSVTNNNGQVTLKINQNTGTYAIKVNYAGDDIDWAPASAQATLKVNKMPTKIAASNYAMFIKKATYYKVTLKDSNGNPLASQKLTIKVNKKTYKVKTNSKGVAKVKLKLKKGKYTVQIRHVGSNKYLPSKKTAKITVKKTLKTKLNAPKVTVAPKKSSKYTVILKDENGNALKKQKLIIKVNGKKYTKKTNGKGQATIKVKFSKLKTYNVKVTYKGVKKYKKSSITGKVIVKKQTNSPGGASNSNVPQNYDSVEEAKVKTQLSASNRTFSLNSIENYIISLKDSTGQALANHLISYTLDNKPYSSQTDAKGQVKVNVSSLDVGQHIIDVNCPQKDKYDSSSSRATINILNKTGVTFIDGGLSGDEIQSILDNTNNPVDFLANVYNDVSLAINNPLNITFKENTVLNGKANSPVLTINADYFNVSNLVINANEGSGIVVNADNVTLKNNTINNNLDQSQMSKYDSGELAIPGNGISLAGANNARISQNYIKSFGNAIFAQDSDNVEMDNNTLSSSNYGINYGMGVKNTQITDNLITKNIGLYVMDVPEGPLGYGIFLNQSAVNVSITNNRILDNYMGISVDANNSTGIVILSNWISDNALEGIRFNAGYDLAENAVEPNVNDNAIYRNARGPSMMILGELSANPEGIYQYGEFNDTKRLQLGTNWYGKNARITWDYATNTTGYGTMCPRIATTYISVKEIEVVSPGNYQVKFYKNDTVASKLPVFEMYATLNNNVEIKFEVVEGVGTFSFDSGYNIGENLIEVSIGSLKDQYRTFEVLLDKNVALS